MLDFKSFTQSKEYDIAMFKHHCETLKKLAYIASFDRKTKTRHDIKSFEELAKNYFPNLDMRTKLIIKKEVGL